MTSVILRVLSGPHLGAAIELGPGLYLVGSAAEADLVLAADETVAGRHLELTVREEPLGIAARPLAAPATLGGRELPPEGLPMAQGEVLALGFTALAWRPAGEDWGPITLVPLEYAERLAGSRLGLAREPERPPADALAPAPEAEGQPALAEEPGVEPPSLEPPSLEPHSLEPEKGSGVLPKAAALTGAAAGGGRRWAFRLGAFILLLLLGLLTLGQWGEGLTRRDAAEKLNAHLAREGLAGVRAELAEGTLILRGRAADDRELALIAGLAAAQPYPVKMEVRVLDDRLRAVRETMNSKGFYPEVGLDREGRLEIAVYMKDALVEDRAFYMLDDDLRGLAQAVRRVVHARELRPVLERELRRIGLERVKPDYQDGLVKLPLTPDPDERRRLGEALENVRQELGAPLVFQMADGRTERAATALAPELSPAEDSGLDNLAVMSVTQGPLPFITLSDGQKFFIGAVLPNGATLVGLGDGKLEMALGDTIIIQTLMENQ